MSAEMPNLCGKDALNIMEGVKKSRTGCQHLKVFLSKMCFAIKSELSVWADLAITVLRLLLFCWSTN